MICYVCTRNATHLVYKQLKPVCNVHFEEAVREEEGDIMVTTITSDVNRTANESRIEQIKVGLDIVKAKRDILFDLSVAFIGKADIEVVNVVNNKINELNSQQDELFAEWKKLSEENYKAFQKWFDGLKMGVNE